MSKANPPVSNDTPGIYLVRNNLPALMDHVCTLGYAIANIDMAGSLGKTEALKRIADSLGFPDWFGHNWDALYDCLSDMSWKPAPGHLIVLDHLDDLRQHSPADYAALLDVLRDVAKSQADAGVPTWFFIGLDALATDRPERP